jgi:hypothetical protein
MKKLHNISRTGLIVTTPSKSVDHPLVVPLNNNTLVNSGGISEAAHENVQRHRDNCHGI